ncbi:MAG: DUF58 domain-containing protein [Planctomycetota bacterium]|nr:DUF58 domain-containing protein [Planctomycetota bacterium]
MPPTLVTAWDATAMAERLGAQPASTGVASDPDALLTGDFMRRLDQLDVLSRKILAGKLKGERRSKMRGQSVEFADYRQYVAGDDLRHIDWNLYARLDKLFLRLFMEEEDLALSVLLDVSKSMRYGQPDKLLCGKRLAAALAYIGLVNYNRVNVCAFADTIVGHLPNLRGRRPVPQVFDFLDGLQPASAAGDLAASARRFAMTVKGKGIVVLISDFLDKGDLASALRYLASDRYDVYVLQILSPQEIDPAANGLVGDLALRDLEDRQTTEVSITPALMKRYKATLEAFCQGIREQCMRRDMMYMLSDTSVPFEAMVLRYLRERGLLG